MRKRKKATAAAGSPQDSQIFLDPIHQIKSDYLRGLLTSDFRLLTSSHSSLMPVRLGPFYLALPMRSIQRFSISAFETRSLPNDHSLLPLQLYLDHSHYLVLAPATLAALPPTRAIPDRDVFYVARISRSNSINRAEGNRLKDGQCPNESRQEAQVSKARTESFAFF